MSGQPYPKPEPRVKAPKRLAPMSAKRRKQQAERAVVREQVHARDGQCVGPQIWPEVECGSPWPDRPRFEVDELSGGSARCVEWLDADRCQLLCQRHHDVKTDNKREWLRRRSTFVATHGEGT